MGGGGGRARLGKQGPVASVAKQGEVSGTIAESELRAHLHQLRSEQLLRGLQPPPHQADEMPCKSRKGAMMDEVLGVLQDP